MSGAWVVITGLAAVVQEGWTALVIIAALLVGGWLARRWVCCWGCWPRPQFAAMSEDQQPKRNLIEQHFQSVLLAIITAALIYSGTFVVQAREDAVRTASQLAALTSEVAGLRSQIGVMQGNYVQRDDYRDDYRDHEARLRHLEGRK